MNTLALIALCVGFTVFCLLMIFQRRLRWNEEIEQRLTTTVVVETHAPQRQRPVSDLLDRYLGGSALAARWRAN